AYWEMDFPDRGEEERGENAKALVDRFEHLLLKAVEERLRADVPVGSYLSGGVDSSVIAALACHVKGPAINTYTVRVDAPDLDELDAANLVARHIGTKPPIVQNFRTEDALNTYPRLIHAAEAPVVDTSCAALLQLAQRVHSCNQKVVLTGEGADEWLIGYPWYKGEKILNSLDVIPGFPLSDWFRRGYLRLHNVPQYPARYRRAVEVSLGGPNAWIDAYGLLAISKLRFYAPPLRDVVLNHNAWADLQIPMDRAKRWHPLNRGVWVAARVTLAGLLLQAKGDRVAMNSSVEVRYPFLDEEVFSFLASLDPRWKLSGFRDKHLLRLLAKRWVPPSVYRRQKVIFRAPLDSFHIEPEPPFVSQLMSEESLRRTGYFNVEQVRHWRHAFRQLRPGSLERLSVEMGLVAVVATQLWHHLFIRPDLAEIPSLTANGELAEKASLRSG
ncbi:MAG TPA: asparagine synthase C-terminal domain-containing protein, partial [Chthoniobacterales bacterium]|nr:asparagine synthase C-terminal domain-containing protein [Chthoniobacterales bacterium]